MHPAAQDRARGPRRVLSKQDEVPAIASRCAYKEHVAAARSRLGEAARSEGRKFTPEAAVEYALREQKPPENIKVSPSYPANLSAREVEVLRLVAEGLTNAQVAEELYISPRTVNAHMGSVYHKIGASSRAQAARFASEHGLL